MPRRPAARTAGQEVRTTASLDAEAKRLAERRRLAHAAAVWAHESSAGSKAACKQEQFKGLVTYNMVEPLLREQGHLALTSRGELAASGSPTCMGR